MLRRWFSFRSMMWHLLMILIVSGCSYAAWWQFHRAAGGNTLSYLYSIEWPAFAIVAIIGWWQLVTEKPEEFQARREANRQLALPKPVAYDTGVLRRELAAHPELVRAFPELVKAFPELETARGELAGGDDGGSPAGGGAVVRAESGGAPSAGAESGRAPALTEAEAEMVPAPSAEVQAYNQVLGDLAARGKPKTWRNPRGKA